MYSVNPTNPSATDLGHLAIQDRDGKAVLNEMLKTSSTNSPTQNDIAHMADTAAAGALVAKSTGSNSSSGNTVSAADRKNEADKGAVAARRSAGSTDSSTSSSKESKNIDYAAVYKKDLQGQLHALKNAPRTPENQAKHKELTDKIAAIDSNTSGTGSNSSISTSANNSKSSAPTKAADAKTVQTKLKTEITELENEQAESPTAEREGKLKELKQNLDYVNRFLVDTKNKANTDLSVSV
jgi:hypothetical protein